MRSTTAVTIVSVGLAFLSMCMPNQPTASSPQAAAQPGKVLARVEARAVWIWGSTVRAQGAAVVAERLKERGMTDAILLVKGSAGTVAYPSAIAPPAAAADTLGEFIDACHARGIRVHAWLNYHQDDAYGEKTKRAYSIWHVRTMPAPPSSMNDGRICPLRAEEGYNAYFLSIVQEILDRYDVDGIHLDYIRYPHTVYCFCPAHQARAAAEGIDVARVRALINKTYYPAPGDGKTFFNAFAAGDPDAVKWVGLREAEINGVVEMVKQTVDGHNAATGADPAEAVQLSAALMPEGALSGMVTDLARSDQFALCHYGQGYEAISGMASFITPMSYHKDYGQPAAWVGQVTSGAVAKAAPQAVWAGIQVYDVTSQAVADALAAARWNGASGFALFRYGVSSSGELASQALVPAIESLIEATAGAGDAGWIDADILPSLTQKLRNVQKSLDAGDTRAAANRLGAYVNELQAQGGKHVDARAAHALMADAAWVVDLIK
ncbi:MAG TPA: family 10 glycosylhydrolase [Vicinamibacterales bacterium]|nr:family 10 glycosylhydrolase [Vicinamibacterales bacterium]